VSQRVSGSTWNVDGIRRVDHLRRVLPSSKGVRAKRTREVLYRYGVDPDRADTYVPEVAIFFADLAELRPDLYAEQMLLINH
jgi:hypothetical protein